MTTFRIVFASLLMGCALLCAGEPRSESGAVTPVERERGRHEAFLKRITEGPTDLLLIGDSIFDFWPKFGSESWKKLAVYKPANFGVMNDRTDNVIWRLDNGELDGFKPDPKVVAIMIGTNNFGHFAAKGTKSWEEPAWCAAGVKAIVQRVQKKLPKSKILLYGIFPTGAKGSDRRTCIEQANEILKTFADSKTVFYYDITSLFLDKEGGINKEMMFDGLHPSAKGYDAWLAHMEPLLKKLIK